MTLNCHHKFKFSSNIYNRNNTLKGLNGAVGYIHNDWVVLKFSKHIQMRKRIKTFYTTVLVWEDVSRHRDAVIETNLLLPNFGY